MIGNSYLLSIKEGIMTGGVGVWKRSFTIIPLYSAVLFLEKHRLFRKKHVKKK
jgi:hypothetical protein